MGDRVELHPGLDELREQILLEDDAGTPVVLRVDVPLRPASQRLMDSLGVTVEVRPVSAAATHTRAGTLTAVEQARRHQEWADRQPTTTRCSVHGCDWVFEGAAGEARDAFAEHRKAEHPTVARIEARSRARDDADRARAEAQADRRRQQLAAAATIAPPRHGNQQWTRESMIAAVHRFVAEHGRPPTVPETIGNRTLPPKSSVLREFGKWSDLIVACGFERPTRGGRRATPLARTTQDSSDERAVDPTAEEGPRSPTPPVGRADEQQPALGARSQAATADGSGAAGDAQPAADPEADLVAVVLRDVECELRHAMLANAPQHSPHEGWALIREELDEVWLHVRMDTGRGQAARVEAIQVAAMALRYVHDLSEAAA